MAEAALRAEAGRVWKEGLHLGLEDAIALAFGAPRPRPVSADGLSERERSVVVHRRRCGKPSCRCADGESLHEAVVLSYSEGGRTRFVMLPAAEVAGVRAAVERYRAERARLDEAAEAGRAALVARLGRARGQR